MSYENQSLQGFLDARKTTSELLHERELKKTDGALIGFEEALVMQAISDLLIVKNTFYGKEVLSAVTGETSGYNYRTLHKFEHDYNLTVSALEDADYAFSQGRPRRREYSITEFGRTIFGLYVPKNIANTE